VLTYLDYKYSQANEDADMTTFKRAVITQELKGRVRQLVEARLLSAALDGNLTKEVENWMAEFASNGDNAALARSLSAKLALARRLAPGQPAPVISMQRRDGTNVTWADLAGKVVYLDFWASWCGPCRQEMPYSHALIERMGEENVAFVYLSIDQDTKAWRKGLKDLGLEEAGVQLWTPEIEETGTAFAFDGIPTYYILDTKGNIFMRNAPRPSDPEAEVQIRAALEMNR
jgi:thiol-disulfide isomerase/thioredoxin